MSAILRDAPPSVSEIAAGCTRGAVRLIQRCLEKRPDDRVQTARDIYNELRHVQKQLESGASTAGSSRADRRRGVAESLWIAVLPFTTRGSDPDSLALADGLTEDITAGLSRFPSLSVVALQSARELQGFAARRAADR